MLFQANMPESFWAEAMQMACQTLNYLPNEAIEGEIPWEKWHQKELTQYELSALRPFGCIVYALIETGQGKFTTRATRGCLVGMPSNTIYRYWDFEKQGFHQSHNVEVKETQFTHPQDFDEPPAAPPLPPHLAPKAATPHAEPPIIYDEIRVELPPAIQDFAAKSTAPINPNPLDTDPATFREAVKRSDSHHSKNAMKDEFQNLSKLKAWTLTDLPPGRRANGSKWVYRT
jgi:hypothetical protein